MPLPLLLQTSWPEPSSVEAWPFVFLLTRFGISTMDASTNDHQDPFAPIQKVAVSAPGQSSTSYSVRIDDTSTDKGWREVGISPPTHLVVPNRELCRMADEIASRSPFDWRGVRLFHDGRRFAYALSTDDVFVDIGGPEVLCAGLLFHTSYDGSWTTGCRLFGYRLVSTSGLLHTKHFGHLRFENPPCSDSWDEEIHRALEYVGEAAGKLETFGDVAAQLKDRGVSSTDLADLRRGALAQLPTPLWGLLLDEYLSGTTRTAWDLLTTGTSLLWNEKERPSVAEDFLYNQALTEGVTGAALGEITAKA